MDLIGESEKLAGYLIGSCSSESGLLAEKIDLRSNAATGNCMVKDLGDYVPFFYWLGSITHRKYSEFAEEQIRLAVKYCQMPNGFFDFNLNKNTRFPLRKTDFKMLNVSEHGDIILGMVMMYELTGREEYKKYAEHFFMGLEKYAISGNGLVYSHVIPALNLKMPLSAGTYSGVFIEEAVRLYRFTGDDSFLEISNKMASGWIETDFFKRYGLFSFEVIPSAFGFLARGVFEWKTGFNIHTAMTMKSNTNILFGLLSLYSMNREHYLKESIHKWMDSLSKITDEKGRFYSFWDPRVGQPEVINLETNHAVADVLVEGYLMLGNKRILDLVEKNVRSWMDLQTSSGLIANGVDEAVPLFDITGKRKYIEAGISRLDSQTDFSALLLKLYLITGKKVYYEAAGKILEGVLDRHRFKNGFVEFVDLGSGEKSGFVIETKYLALLLKFFLLYSEISEGRANIKDEMLMHLIRDR